MSAVDEALSGAKDDTEANPTWKDQFVTLDSSGQASFARLSECDYVRRDVVEAALKHLAAKLERAEARAAELSAAMAAVFEIAAGCDGPEFEAVFSIAHDACKTCAGCFGEGRAPLPLVPARAVWMAEQRAKQAEAQLEAASREGWRACVLLAAAKEQIEADRTYAEADRAGADGADESAIEELHEQAGAFEDEARRLRACLSADDKQEAKP